MRAKLARVLLEEPDILLLDEPTNHMDLESVEWLQEWASRFRGARSSVRFRPHISSRERPVCPQAAALTNVMEPSDRVRKMPSGACST